MQRPEINMARPSMMCPGSPIVPGVQAAVADVTSSGER